MLKDLFIFIQLYRASPFEPATGDFRRLSRYLSPATLNDFSRKNYNPFFNDYVKKKEGKKRETLVILCRIQDIVQPYTYTYTYFSRE